MLAEPWPSRCRTLAARFGLVKKGREPAILLLGASRAGFDAIKPLIVALRESGSRLDVVLCSADPTVRAHLIAEYPSLRVTAPPLGPSLVQQLFLGRFRVRTAVVVETWDGASRRFFSALTRRATPLVVVSGRGREPITALGELPIACDYRIVIEPDGPAMGLDSLPAKRPQDGCLSLAASASAALLLPLVGRDRKWLGRSDFNPTRMLGRRLAEKVAGAELNAGRRRCLGARLSRIDSVDALRAHLHQPQTILALGNGPTSEAPEVLNAEFEALFRANHSWQQRGHLCHPQVVFTGQKSSMVAINQAVVGVYDANTERVLLAARSRSLLWRRLDYFVAERLLGEPPGVEPSGYRPTSGAIMVALAVTLQPSELIIAGMDLFQHPQGSYPGDPTTANAYTPAHNADVELTFILSALANFRGQLRILSPPLARAWAAYQTPLHD